MLLTTWFVLLVLAVASVQSDICPEEKTFNELMMNTAKKDFTSLVENNEYVDVWRRKEFAETMSCSMTKFALDDSGHLKVVMHNVGHDGREYRFHDIWAEHKGTGTVFIVGSMAGYADYMENFYLFYMDENVYGYWACYPQTYHQHKFWRAAVSVVKGKSMDDPEVKASLEAATKRMKELEHLTGEMALMSQTRCPHDFPVHEIVPQTTRISIP